MQLSIDGFVAGPGGELDWLVGDWDDKINEFVTGITKPVDCIVLGRKIVGDFINKMIDTPKVVFSKTVTKNEWANTTLINGDLVEEIKKLKDQPGGDIIAYGGAGFVSSLIKNNLIDEYYLFINPVAIGKGMTIFKDINDKLRLKLVKSKSFDCGIVMLCYTPVRK